MSNHDTTRENIEKALGAIRHLEKQGLLVRTGPNHKPQEVVTYGVSTQIILRKEDDHDLAVVVFYEDYGGGRINTSYSDKYTLPHDRPETHVDISNEYHFQAKHRAEQFRWLKEAEAELYRSGICDG